MVSKLRSVFHSLLGPERPSVSTTGRKRSLDEEVSDDEDNDYVTPDLKRPKLHAYIHQPLQAVENGSDPSPLVRVTEWMKQKALSFGESYFYRKPGQNQIENRLSGDVHAHKESSFEGMYIYKPKRNGSRRQQAPTRLFVGGKQHKNKMSHVVIEQDSGSESSTPEDKHSEQEVLSMLSGRGSVSDKLSCTTYHAAQPESDLADLPTASDASHHQIEPSSTRHTSTKSKQIPTSQCSLNTTKPINKIISRPPISGVPSHSTTSSYAKVFPRSIAASHLGRHKASYTVKESIRLQQRQEYQKLLQQFTTTEVKDLRPEPPVDTSKQDLILDSDTQQHETSRVPSTTLLGSTFSIPQFTSRKEIQGGRVLPHHYTSKRELREAARQRLHAPSSDISTCVTPSSEKKSLSTPSQPDFSRSDSPIITAVHMPGSDRQSKGSGPISSFQLSLSQSAVAQEDWIKEMKERFESSTRDKLRRVEEETIKTKIYKERRLHEMGRLEQTIRERMLIAEQEPPVLEEVADHSEDEVSDVEELTFLTQEMEDAIDDALISEPAGQILVEGFRCSLTRNHIQTLNGLNWLNDEVINFYFSLLVERSEQDSYPSMHNFNTFFYPKLLQGGHNPIRRWTKKVDIFSKNLILVPVHLGVHWCLAVIDMRNKTITYYDSMGNANPKCLQALRQYLYDEYKDKKQGELDLSGWKLINCMDIPLQMNGCDCGMFACKYAEYISRDATITFTQEDMPYFRRRMVWEIINKKLL
ncbi:sentrin-specific protease 1-like [Anneissia japonica]|uniref:sentrin-specific protease 1-like n=1 Tax=Anneissia japonica TaxID=1529436 RepID=UPI00142562D0|nr:sentrin-specific protease 1-like [Anneissia japonica]